MRGRWENKTGVGSIGKGRESERCFGREGERGKSGLARGGLGGRE